MAMASTSAFAPILGAFGLYLLYVFLSPGKRLSLPPGPKPKFLIGNLFDLPKPGELEAVHWLKHRDLYGPLSSVTIMGQTLIIINEARLAFELMEKRSVKHSSRPKQTFAGEMVGWENTLAFLPYGNRFRTYRRHAAQVLGSNVAVSSFNPLQEVEVGHFMLRVLDTPDDLVVHIRKEAGAVILKISYDYTIEPHKTDPLVALAGKAMDEFGQAAVPGAWTVDMIPYLKYLPDWFPGTEFKQTARQWRKTVTDLVERPYKFVKHRMAQGTYEKSFLSQLLESGQVDLEETFKWLAMSLYAAGADTTVSSMASFFLAMTLFPDVQRKAQEEIEQVIGTDRLPGFQDRQNLPYIEALLKEVLRWQPVVPMGLPHMTTEDDICEGYLVPKGALLLPNIWWFTHDPEVYHEPMVFKPERFLPGNGKLPEPDPNKVAFGFGRRICPGRLLADSNLYLNIVQILSVFRISKAVENGQEVEPVVNSLPGVVSHPAPFKTTIKPRSPEHEALLRSIEKIHPWQQSDTDVLESITY